MLFVTVAACLLLIPLASLLLLFCLFFCLALPASIATHQPVKLTHIYTHTHTSTMTNSEHVQSFSTGRGGAGNVVHGSPQLEPVSSQQSQSNNELTAQISNSFRHDKDGKAIYSTGRGGHSNLAKADEVPSPRLEPSVTEQHQLTPVFSTGRGGAGNVVHTNRPNTMAEEIDGQISPVHSRNNASSKPSGSKGFMGKVKKLFS